MDGMDVKTVPGLPHWMGDEACRCRVSTDTTLPASHACITRTSKLMSPMGRWNRKQGRNRRL